MALDSAYLFVQYQSFSVQIKTAAGVMSSETGPGVSSYAESWRLGNLGNDGTLHLNWL